MDEWIPTEQFPLKKDNITDAYFGVIYAKFPSSALGHHGILIRLLSSDEQTKGNVMYTLSLQRNRVMTLSKSFLDSTENRDEIVQLEEISNSYKWLNSDTYTGLWFLVKYGYIAFGILDEHTLGMDFFINGLLYLICPHITANKKKSIFNPTNEKSKKFRYPVYQVKCNNWVET